MLINKILLIKNCWLDLKLKTPSLWIRDFFTHFSPMFHFYTPWKAFGFLMFSKGIEIEHWIKMGLSM